MYLWLRNPAQLVHKRGQSFETTLTASSYPTARPSSSYDHGHAVPTIDGSEGGFIGLIAGLGILAIASSIAVWFFWRRYKRKQAPYSQSSGTFPKPGGGLFGRKKSKGWMQTQSFTDGGDEDAIRMDAQRGQQYANHRNESTASVGVPTRGRVYDDPFNADSLDNLQRETSAAIDHGPEYQRVATGGERATTPPVSPPLASGTRFHEGL